MGKPIKLPGVTLHLQNNAGEFVPLKPIGVPDMKPLNVSCDFQVSDEFLSAMSSIADEQAKVHAQRLHAETERWMWKAIAQGVGNRVWRSDPEFNEDTFAVTYKFMILAPGQHPPASGLIFGPFSDHS